MGGEGKHPPPLDEVEVPPVFIMSEGGDGALDWFEGIARQFLRPFGQVDYDLVLQTRIPGSFRIRDTTLTFQEAVLALIVKHGHPSGIREDVFFVSLPGVPVRLRLDTTAFPHSIVVRFRAISR